MTWPPYASLTSSLYPPANPLLTLVQSPWPPCCSLNIRLPPMLPPQCLCTYSCPGINMAEPSSPSGFCSPRYRIYRFLCLSLLQDYEFHKDFALVAALLPDLEWYPEFGRNIYKYIYACMYICVECGGNQLHVSLRECLQCFRCQ